MALYKEIHLAMVVVTDPNTPQARCADGHGTLTWNGNNYNTIVVRRVDGASNVASYQMFQIWVAAFVGTILFPPATLTKFSQ